jgi:hypothetical protein
MLSSRALRVSVAAMLRGDRAIEIDHGRGRHDAKPVIERGNAWPVGIAGPAMRARRPSSAASSGHQPGQHAAESLRLQARCTRSLDVDRALRPASPSVDDYQQARLFNFSVGVRCEASRADD